MNARAESPTEPRQDFLHELTNLRRQILTTPIVNRFPVAISDLREPIPKTRNAIFKVHLAALVSKTLNRSIYEQYWNRRQGTTDHHLYGKVLAWHRAARLT